MTFEEFEGFEQHAIKTGGTLARKIVDQVKPGFDKIKNAMELLS